MSPDQASGFSALPTLAVPERGRRVRASECTPVMSSVIDVYSSLKTDTSMDIKNRGRRGLRGTDGPLKRC